MTHLLVPTSDGERLAVLEALLEQINVPTSPGPSGEDPTTPEITLAALVPQETVVQLESLVPRARQGLHTIDLKKSSLRAAVDTARRENARLAACVKQIWHLLLFRENRMALPPETAKLCEAPATFHRNAGKGPRRWIRKARELLSVLTEAEAAGMPALGEPTTDELQALHDAVEAAFMALNQAKAARKQAQNTLTRNRGDMVVLYRRLATCVRSGLAHYPAARRRDIMRSMGFHFLDQRPTDAPGDGTTDTTPDTGDTPDTGTGPSGTPAPETGSPAQALLPRTS